MYPFDGFKIVLKNAGANRIAVIKALRETTALSISEAVTLMSRMPVTVTEYQTQERAEAIRQKLAEAGAEVEVEAIKNPIAGVDYL